MLRRCMSGTKSDAADIEICGEEAEVADVGARGVTGAPNLKAVAEEMASNRNRSIVVIP